MNKLTIAEVKTLVSQGAVIGSCAEIYLQGIWQGYPADQVTPEHRGFREVYQEEGTESVFVPMKPWEYQIID